MSTSPFSTTLDFEIMRITNTTLLAISLFATQQLFAGETWTDLFNGKDLTGWTQKTGNATYSV